MTSDRADSEEAIIGGYWAPLAEGFAGAFGLKDDCALIAPPPGCELVATTDAVIAGVHFFPDEDPGAIAWKALAVNVSDLIAKGAEPLAYLMAVAFPEAPERNWLSAFAAGLARAQARFGCRLAGGDTDRTPGPLSVSITAFGTIPKDAFVRRASARPGDLVFVSGTIGDAALGLALRRDKQIAARAGLDASALGFLNGRYRQPDPHVALATVVRAHARAAMDISDGLVKDFDRLCRVSGLGGELNADQIPLSAPARAVLKCGAVTLADLVTGGEDYEILAVIAPERASEFAAAAQAAGHPVVQIGVMAGNSAGVSIVDSAGHALALDAMGWDHFHKNA